MQEAAKSNIITIQVDDIQLELLPPSQEDKITKETAKKEVFKLIAIFAKIKQRVSD